MNLEWNVYVNDRKEGIVSYNIFDNYTVKASTMQLYKTFSEDKEKFFEELRQVLVYLFWSKYEWEITLNTWTPGEEYRKVDVYNQIYMNWEPFKEYVWGELTKE